jgi:predicted nuclease of restriction endonuclease-like (RecB) superfamily
MIRPTGEERAVTRKQLLAFRAAEEETLRARWAARRKHNVIQSGVHQRSLPDGQGPGRDTQCPSGVNTETTNKEEVTGNE